MTRKVPPLLQRAADCLHGRFCTMSAPFAILVAIVVAMASSN